MPDEIPGVPNPADSSPEVTLPYPDEVLFAPLQRSVVPRPVYRHRRIKGIYARCVWFTRIWSVGRLIVGLFCVFAFGLLGVAVADALFCPEGTSVRFWEGCLYETIGFGAGGGLLGFAFSIMAVQALDHQPSSKSDSAVDANNPGRFAT